jgi:DNA-binding CsgD family transcriptional regulator
MAEQLTLLVLVLAVAAGLVTATVSAVFAQSHRTAFFRYFLAQTLLFNLLVLASLVLHYLRLRTDPAAGMLALLGLLSLLKLGWLQAFASMLRVLPGQELPDRFGLRFLAVTASSFALCAALFALGELRGWPRLTAGAGGMFELFVLGVAVIACLQLVARAARMAAGPRRRSLRGLGVLYLAVFAVILGSLAFAWLRASGQTQNQVLFNSALLVVYNLLPLTWILRFQPRGPIEGPSRLDRYGITAREREIIELICEGKINREIADRLFISVATVKDHNYNIFKKTGVRNRVELVNLVGRPS